MGPPRQSDTADVGLVSLFASVLRRDADGRYYLVTRAEKADVAVEDAPLLAMDMDAKGAGRAQIIVTRTNIDDVVRLGTAHGLRFASVPDGGLKPYALVRRRIEAPVTRSSTYGLAELLAEEETGRLGVWSDGVFFAVPAVERL